MAGGVRDSSGRKLSSGSCVVLGPEIKNGRTRLLHGEEYLTPVETDVALVPKCFYLSCVGKPGVVLKVDATDNTAVVQFPDVVLDDPEHFPSDHLCPLLPTLHKCGGDIPTWGEKLFEDDTFKDVTFKLLDGEERAHRCVLAAESEVFAAMFAGPMREAATGSVELRDVTRHTMRIFLRHIYTDEVEPKDWGCVDTADSKGAATQSAVIPLELLLCVTRLANKYLVKRLLAQIVEAFKARVDNSKNDIKTFDEVLAAAIAVDLSAVRLAAIKVAETSEVVRKGYNAQKFRPEVQAELQALWPPTSPVRVKRARLG